MLVFGKNVFKELKVNNNIRKVYLSKKFGDKDIIDYIKKNGIAYETVDDERLKRMVQGNNQGIVVDINDYEYYRFEDLMNSNSMVILDHLEDPHNLGAIIRTCEAAGIDAIIIPKDRSVRVNETVMKTSAGALNHVRIAEVNNLVQVIKKLKDNNYFIYGADMDGKAYNEIDYAKKWVLVVGNEGKGLSRLVREESDEIISIPMEGKVNSLNVSVATGILLYGIKLK